MMNYNERAVEAAIRNIRLNRDSHDILVWGVGRVYWKRTYAMVRQAMGQDFNPDIQQRMTCGSAW